MILDPFLTLSAQFFLALLLIAAGLHKAADLRRLMAAISAYRAVPVYGVRAAAWLVIAIELSVGGALMFPSTGKPASLAAAGILAVYLFVMGLSMARGHREVDCGCSLHGRVASLSGSHLIRNGVLILWAVVASLPNSGRTLGWLDGIQIVAAVLCLALIYLSADALMVRAANVIGQEL